MNVSSFIDYILLSELTKNIDSYKFNTYFHVVINTDTTDPALGDGFLTMGPMWDLDLGFGNVGYSIVEGIETSYLPQGWHFERNVQWLFPDVTVWFAQLLSDPWFYSQFVSRWAQLRQGKWSTANLHSTVNGHISEVADDPATKAEGPATRHFQRWQTLCQPSPPAPHCHGIWPFHPDQQSLYGLAAYQNWLLRFMDQRLSWIDTQLCGSSTLITCGGVNATANAVPLLHTAIGRGSVCSVSAADSTDSGAPKMFNRCSAGQFKPTAATCPKGMCCEECRGPYDGFPQCATLIGLRAIDWTHSQSRRDNLCQGGAAAQRARKPLCMACRRCAACTSYALCCGC